MTFIGHVYYVYCIYMRYSNANYVHARMSETRFKPPPVLSLVTRLVLYPTHSSWACRMKSCSLDHPLSVVSRSFFLCSSWLVRDAK